MNVLSLFDGMSCGQIALERTGFKVDKYYASEIKKIAIRCCMNNFPDTIQLGDVRGININDLPIIGALIGGSPCQDISYLKHGSGGIYGDKSGLFFEYYRVLKRLREINPDIKFLLENVNGRKASIDVISNLLGVQPIRINSSLVSFQNRDRLYWTNIEGVGSPKDKHINFQDFKETNNIDEYMVNKTPSRIKMWGNGVNGKCPNVTDRGKINCLTRKQDRWNNSGLVEYGDFCRYLTVRECELAQTVPIGYTSCLSKNQAWDLLGDGWTVDVIAHILSYMK